MTSTPWTARIRKAVHDGPSANTWRVIAGALDEGDDPAKVAEMIRFVDKHTNRWPSELRVAPLSWWLDAISERGTEKLSLARALVIDGAVASPRIVRALADHAASRQILHLSLDDAKLGDEGVAILAASPRFVALETLSIAGNGIGEVGAHALARSPSLPALKRLDLARNALTAAALIAIVGATRSLKSLEALNVADNELGLDAARDLAACTEAERLRELDLSGNALGDRGAAAIAASPYLPRLGVLRLERNGLTSTSVRAFEATTRLKELAVLELGVS